MNIALINNKGGQAKTTTAVNLGAGLARKGRRVLVVDLDAQGSASLSLGVARDDLEPSSSDVVLNGTPIRDAIRKTTVDGLDLLTGSMRLASADLALAAEYGREQRLKRSLDAVRSDYDFILLDCPPSLSLLPVNALVAADFFVVPVSPDYLALEGLANLMTAVGRIQEGIGTAAELLGLVLTMVDYRQKAATEAASIVRQQFGKQVFKTEVRVNVRLKEAPSFGKTIFDYDPTSPGAAAYSDLTDEVLRRLKGRKS